jgi:DNA-binding MarR family transcriptional regulator
MLGASAGWRSLPRRMSRSAKAYSVVVLALSAAGKQLQRHAIAFRTGRLEKLLADWTAEEITTFTRLLERFARSARRPKEHKL